MHRRIVCYLRRNGSHRAQRTAPHSRSPRRHRVVHGCVLPQNHRGPTRNMSSCCSLIGYPDAAFEYGPNATSMRLLPPARRPFLYDAWFDYSVTRALRKWKADVFVSTDGMLSRRTTVPQLAVFHDLNFMHHPEWMPAQEARYYRSRFPEFARIAKRLVTVSEFSKGDIVEQFRRTVRCHRCGVQCAGFHLCTRNNHRASCRRTIHGRPPLLSLCGQPASAQKPERLARGIWLYRARWRARASC